MGQVFQAQYLPKQDSFALKLISPNFSQSPNFGAQFNQLVTVLSQLKHAHIASVLDFGQDQTLAYLVMALIDGPTLRDELTTRCKIDMPFSDLACIKIFATLAGALNYAHSQHVVHGNLHPGNIMFTPGGQIKLTDFGLTCLVSTNTLVTNPAYLSPEQAQGQPAMPASDIYALSAILYEMLIGQAPFSGKTEAELLDQQINATPPAPRQLQPNIPPQVEQIILKGLSKNPVKRYATAWDMSKALQETLGTTEKRALSTLNLSLLSSSNKLNGEDLGYKPDLTQATPSLEAPKPKPQPEPQPQPQPKSNPISAAPTSKKHLYFGLGGLMIIGVVGLVLALNFFKGEEEASLAQAIPQTNTPPILTPTLNTEDKAQVEATTTQAWLMADDDQDGLSNEEELALNTAPDKADTDADDLTDQAEVNIHQTDPLNPDSDEDGLKDGLEVAQGLSPLNNDSDEDGLLDAQDPAPLEAPTSTPTSTSTPSPSPSSTATPLPTSTPAPTASPTASPLPTSTTVPSATPTITPSPSATLSPTPSPLPIQGQLAYERAGQIYIRNLSTKEETALATGTEPHLSFDGTKLTWKEEGGIVWLDLNTGRKTQISTDAYDIYPALSTDGQKVAFINKKALYIWELGLTKNIFEVEGAPSWSPDDNWILYTLPGGLAYKYFRAGENNNLPVKIAESVFEPAWGPNWQIAFMRAGDIYIMDENGTTETQITSHPSDDYAPTWSPDGDKIIFVSERDGNPELYAIDLAGGSPQRLSNTTSAEASPSWGR